MPLRWFGRGGETATRSRNCPVCDTPASGIRAIGTLPTTGELAFERDRYDLVECRTCHLVFISPLPPERDLHRLYVESNQFTDAVYTDPRRVEAILEYMNSCLTRILAHLGRERDAAIATLEIGGGLAWLARAAKASNPRSATTAQDISPEPLDRCPWVDAYVRGPVSDARIDARAPYDVVSLTHVIEHLVDPLDVVRRCKSLLAPGGVILVTAPHRPPGWRSGSRDIAAWRAYSYNHVPAHIQYFSRTSMRALARKLGCELTYWNDASEGGQAFEAWLSNAVR
ncbi:MAG: class I SAM-dependent methyltransferase [Rudaea sp.]